MNHIDLTPIYRSAIGFDQIANAFDSIMREANTPSYPPYDIEQLGDDSWKITLAVAGFATDEIDVEVNEQTVIIKGSQKANEAKREYLHKGIATRNFERKFSLAEYVKVTGATHKNGLLSLTFEREVPKEKKSRKIKID